RMAGKVPPAEPLADLAARLPVDQAPSDGDDRAGTVTIPRAVARTTLRRRLRRRLLVFALVLLALAGAAWAAWTFLVPLYTKVPRVIGLTGPQATKKLDSAGPDAQFGTPVAPIH